MSEMDRLRNTEITPRTAFFSIVVLLLVTTGVIIGARNFFTGPSTSNSGKHAGNGKKRIVQANVTGIDTGGSLDIDDRQDACKLITERNLFKQVLITKGSVVSLPVKIANPPPTKQPVDLSQGKQPVSPPKMIDTGNLALTGIVNMPLGVYALLEDKGTQKAEYVMVGASAFGFKVVSLVGKTVTLEQNGMTATLILGEVKAVPPPANPPPEKPAKNPGENPNGQQGQEGKPQGGQPEGEPPQPDGGEGEYYEGEEEGYEGEGEGVVY